MVELRKRPLLVLIASKGEWSGRSVESVLELNGYTVLRVETGRRALELARRTNPDALILESRLDDVSGIDVCRALADDPAFDPGTPIFITSPAPASNRARAAAYEAGAWEFCTEPLDVETLLLKMGTFVRARRRLEEAQSTSLIDPLTGLYSMYGLQHWAEQLGARAARKHESFACIAVTSDDVEGASPQGRPVSAALSYMADVCRAQSRKSDVVGYVGESRFAILAPDTDGDGARQFVGRLQQALDRGVPAGGGGAAARLALHAGFYATPDFGSAGVQAIEVVQRAETALQYAQLGGLGPALSFDEIPIS
jgi:PleD family two-component response regulator